MSPTIRTETPFFLRVRRTIAAALLGVLAASCTLLEESDLPFGEPPAEGGDGVVNLQLQLAQNVNTLAKSASADTIFSLDSLTIILSANGAPTQTHTFAVTGRADLGNIVVPPQTFVLSSLRLWKAKFVSIDTTSDPVRRDTVHLDSAFFNVRMAETTFVAKTVSPAWSILRVRFRSTNADSLVHSVKFLRLRVNGVVRDSMILGAKNASLNWLQAMPGNTIHAAGDSGRILRSTNDGANWTEVTMTTEPLVGGHFHSSSLGSVISASGKVFTTVDGGANWGQRHNTPDSVNAAMFSEADLLWTVGRNGGIYKSGNAGWGWWTLVSNTSQTLNGISFPTPSVAFVVGENETILKTSNATAAPGSPPQNGGVIWAPVAGGWFPQTSNSTSNIKAIQFTSNSAGWAMGHNYAYLTLDGGATWENRTSALGMNVNAISFLNGSVGFAVGEGGLIRKMISDWNWSLMSNSSNTIDGRTLHDVEMASLDTVFAVGAGGALLTTTNASQAGHQILWTSQRGWFPQVGVPTWRDAYAIRFAPGSDTGWVALTNGEIYRTTDRGNNWASQNTSGSNNQLTDMHAHNGSLAVAVGLTGTVRRTVNGGASWSVINSGTTNHLNAVTFVSRQVGWVVGAGNTIRSTNDSGKTWTARTGAGTHYGIGISNSKVFVVGASGVVRRSSNRNHNTSFSTALGNAGMTTTQLNAIAIVGNDTAWVVGNGGKIFRSVNANASTASSVTWTAQGVGVTNQNLTRVHFVNSRVGYVSGANGIILKTTNHGTTWTIQNTGTTNALNGLHVVDSNTVYAAGMSGKVIKTADGGDTDTTTYFSVDAVNSALVYAAGSGGRIMKTTNAGESWTVSPSGTTQPLNAISFRNASDGFAVGKNGTLLKTVNGGGSWTSLTSGTSTELTSIKFVTADTGYIVGKGGLVLKTVNGGSSWYMQETPSAVNLNRVHGFSKDMVFAVGENGTILKAVNEGDNWTGGGIKRSLKAVSFPSSTVGYIVGAEGFILKTTNGGDFWSIQNSGTSVTLYSVHFTHVDTGYAVGDGGVILKTVNGGANWTSQAGGAGISLRWTNARNGSRAFAIGGTQTLLSTTNGGNVGAGGWNGSWVGVPGARLFDELLTYKYLKPGVANTILLEAIDDMSLPLRGYQATRTVTVGAGVDSTLSSPMARCGYGTPMPACVP